jgi:hypothetical protein
MDAKECEDARHEKVHEERGVIERRIQMLVVRIGVGLIADEARARSGVTGSARRL